MFTEQDKQKILSVKEKIYLRVEAFKKAPYWNPDLPWKNLFLSGGAICSLLNDEEPNDWDWYFKDLDTMHQFQSHLVKCELFIKDVNEKYGDFGVNGKMITGKAITMDDNNSFITMISADPHTIKKTFDYVHCTPHFELGKLYISEKQYFTCKNKKLIVNNPSMVKEYRREKFIKRGWKE
jgi:hypothetical protein